jgi:GNAT superfamily N-acetyltransferase
MRAASGLRYSIAEFGGNQAADQRALAQLHAALLPESSLPKLGRGFLEHFYYSVLPREGLLFGCVAYLDGLPAGFMVNTPHPGSYVGLGIRRHPVRFAWRMMLAALTNPRSLISALRARKRMAAQASLSRESEAGAPERFLEGLFLGVRPEYSRPGFIRESGIHVGRDLVSRSLSLARGYGAPEMRAGVMRTNTAALMVLLKAGWEIEEEVHCLVTSDDHLELSYSFTERPLAGAGTGPPDCRQSCPP